jgi:hypothetical protein
MSNTVAAQHNEFLLFGPDAILEVGVLGSGAMAATDASETYITPEHR